MTVSGCREGRRPGRPQGRAGRRMRRGHRTGIWLWLLVLGLALVAYGCGGDSEEAAAPPSGDEEASAGPPPEAPPPKPKQAAPKQEKKEPARVLPDNLAEWIEEDYYTAKRKTDPRLIEAVTQLAQSSAGTDTADTAAEILTNLLKKTEEAELGPQPGMYPGGQPGSYPGSQPGSYPGSQPGSYPGSQPGSYPGSMPPASSDAPAGGMPSTYPSAPPQSAPAGGMPGSSASYRPEGGDGDGVYQDDEEEEMDYEEDYEEDDGDYEENEEDYEEYDESMDEDEDDYSEDEEGYPGMGYPEGRRGGPRPARPRVFGASPELIEAIVRGLAVNESQTARQTLKEVIEGKFETDNDRVATFVTLETMVAELSPENEEVLFRCLTAPQDFRELGGAGSGARPSQSPYGQGYSADYGQRSSADYGQGYGPRGRTSRAGKLTGEELQQEAFALMGPVASEEFRVRLARYLASPQSVQEDHDLFGEYIREPRMENIAAQMVLYTAPSVDSETKEVVEDNLLVMSSEALGGILGIPMEQLRARAARRSPSRQGSPYGDDSGRGGYPGYGSERGTPDGMMSAPPEAYDEEAAYDRSRSDDGSGQRGSRMGFAPGRPQATPGGTPGSSGRRSRYDRPDPVAPAGPGSRPSRYGQGEAGPQRPGMPGVEEPDPDEPYRLAEKLWGAELTGLLENRLNQAGSLDSSAPMILLASTMPVDAMRSKLHSLLQAHWKEGPGSLEAAGLLDDVVVDPAFLALVKMLPRKEAPKAKSGATRPRRTLSDLGRRSRGNQGRGYPGRARPGQSRTPDREGDEDYREMGSEDEGGPGMGRRPGAGPEGRSVPEDPAVAWMATSEDLFRVLCERFQAAARNRGRAAGQASQGEPGTQGLPFEIHQDAWVVAEYHLDWPGDDQQKLSGVPLGAMKVHFVRAEQQARPTTMVGYYRRKLTSPDIREVEDGTWMEDFRDAPEAGWKRSIDVMITTTGPAIEKSERAEVPVTVDILCIDVKDPAPAGAAG